MGDPSDGRGFLKTPNWKMMDPIIKMVQHLQMEIMMISNDMSDDDETEIKKESNGSDK